MKKTLLVLVALAAGLAQGSWTERKLVGTYLDWDYWWLNVRLAIDPFDTAYCAVSRYNYSQTDPEFDLYVLNADGDTVRVTRPWSGFEHQPIVQDAAGANLYVGQPLLGFALNGQYQMDAGVTDDSNCVCTSNSQGNDSIYFTRLGPDGSRITWRTLVYGGDPWVGRTGLALDPAGRLHLVSEDGLERLVCCRSEDRGATWSCDTLATVRVLSHARIAATGDTCIHIVFRTWTSGVQLRYMKLRPDGSVAVAPSVFAEGTERWDPVMALDTSGNLRVAYIDGAQNARSLYYTVLRTDLDAGGTTVPDSLLTLVPDTVVQTDPVRIAGPKIVVDSRDRAHIVFEQGVYGSGNTKCVYHIREADDQAVAERPARAMPRVSGPTVVRGILRLAGAEPAELLDASGRRVLSLGSGENDVSRLSPGVYFVRTGAGGQGSGSSGRKVVIAR